MRERLLEIFNDVNFKKPLNVDELYEMLNLSDANDFTTLAKTLNELEEEFLITHNKKGCFASLKFFNLDVGILDVKDKGFGFVDTNDGGIFVHESNLKGAITYDFVMIKIFTDEEGRAEGIVERIIKRGNQYFYGELKVYRNKSIVNSIDNKIKLTIFIKKEHLKKAKKHDIVQVKVNKYYPNNTADGEVVSVIGNTLDKGVDITSMVLSSGINVDFSPEALLEASDISDVVKEEDLLNRRDLTNKLIITIDGEDAKDLDDAITVQKLPNGNYFLGVYIADVSNYVKEGTFLDQDAFNRSTSVYLPDRVIPMLPKKLSNGICSLNENQIRLVMAFEAEINNSGEVVSSEIFEGYIKTRYRMTYHDVNKILLGDEELTKKYYDIKDFLHTANELSKILNKKRIKRGAFLFESPEPKLILNDLGKVTDIILRQRMDAECLIEEFMVIANETVAETMTYLDVPFIYRVHENPKEDKIKRLLALVSSFGLNYKVNNTKSIGRILQTILKDNMIDDTLDEEEIIKRGVINTALIRSMSKAVYQENNIGHFGLASKCYTHFTSPIRRYPDLLVHRLIKEFLLMKDDVNVLNKISFYNSKVNKAGQVSSRNERIAEKLERDAVEYKKCEYMEGFVGKTFTGTISHITTFGIYITLNNTVEGLTLFRDMYDDYYEFDEKRNIVRGTRTNNSYSLGETVKIRVLSSDKQDRTCYFRILGKETSHGKRSTK